MLSDDFLDHEDFDSDLEAIKFYVEPLLFSLQLFIQLFENCVPNFPQPLIEVIFTFFDENWDINGVVDYWGHSFFAGVLADGLWDSIEYLLEPKFGAMINLGVFTSVNDSILHIAANLDPNDQTVTLILFL
jgi:hypothetical protein